MKKEDRLSLKEAQAALLPILEEFDRVCRKYDLRYSLIYGTMLGAIRHKGFIPWDDDIDVCMPRPDYEKLLALSEQEQIFSEHFSLTADRGKKAAYPFLKIQDDRYAIRCTNHIETPYLYVDIFPVDAIPDNRKDIEKLYRKEVTASAGVVLSKWFTADKWWGCFAWIFGFWFYLLCMLFGGTARSVRRVNKLATKIPYESAERVGLHSWCLEHCEMPREAFEHYTEVEFEGKKFRCIEDWDLCLKNTYGDYMQLPPENKRVSQHCIRAYRNRKVSK